MATRVEVYEAMREAGVPEAKRRLLERLDQDRLEDLVDLLGAMGRAGAVELVAPTLEAMGFQEEARAARAGAMEAAAARLKAPGAAGRLLRDAFDGHGLDAELRRALEHGQALRFRRVAIAAIDDYIERLSAAAGRVLDVVGALAVARRGAAVLRGEAPRAGERAA